MSTSLVIGLRPHLIPAPTIPNGDLERAMTEPLAKGRDEVVYLVCTHTRVRFGNVLEDGRYPVFQATGDAEGMEWDTSKPWAYVTLPTSARPSAVRWAVIDPALASVEHLPPIAVDPTRDPDGADGCFRAELLPWIFDRHLEVGEGGTQERGVVEGGEIAFRLEYIGMRAHEALRRPAGAHHKLPMILGTMLLYEPYRWVYFLPCDLIAAVFDSSTSNPVKMLPLAAAIVGTNLDRPLLISAAEDALIELLGTPFNERNTKTRRFPHCTSGEKLARAGIGEFSLNFADIPAGVSIYGQRATATRAAVGVTFPLSV